jgi:hypothetical protein
MGRHAGDPIARAVLSPRYRIIDNWDLFSTIDETYGGQIASAAITDTRLYLKFVFPVLEASMGTIKKKGKEIGDIVNAGAMLVNSEVGYGTLRFNGYLYRLSCKNGAVITETTGEGIKQIHLGPANTEDNWDEYVVTDESAAENFRLFTQIRDALEHTTLNKIDFEELALQFMMTKESAVVVDRGTVLTNTQRMFGISVEESRKIERIWAKDEENSGNKFGFINAITNAARDTAGTMSYDRATELETLCGSLITLEEDVWVKLNETTNVVQISSKRKSRKK